MQANWNLKILFGTMVCLSIVGAVVAQQPQPYPNAGFCYQNGQQINPTNVQGSKCNSIQLCRPVRSCAPVIGLPDGCGFETTIDSALVGVCESSGSSRVCNSCTASGGQIVCMVFKSAATMNPVNGSCSNACGIYWMFGGDCS